MSAKRPRKEANRRQSVTQANASEGNFVSAQNSVTENRETDENNPSISRPRSSRADSSDRSKAVAATDQIPALNDAIDSATVESKSLQKSTNMHKLIAKSKESNKEEQASGSETEKELNMGEWYAMGADEQNGESNEKRTGRTSYLESAEDDTQGLPLRAEKPKTVDQVAAAEREATVVATEEVKENVATDFEADGKQISAEENSTMMPARSDATNGIEVILSNATEDWADIADTTSSEQANVEGTRSKRLTKTRQSKLLSSSESSLDSIKRPRINLHSRTKNELLASSSGSSETESECEDQQLNSVTDNIEDKSPANLQTVKAFIYMIIPPDGGFGWVILIISFLCQVVVDGLIFSIGILMPHIAADLEVTPAEIVLLVSIQIGPVSSATINKYGFRPVALIGSLLSVTSILVASFSPNLATLIFFYSIVGGTSLSMIWMSSQLIIGYYFERLRPMANGISVSGAGAGILMASAINSAVVTHIGWRNTLRIHVLLLSTIFFMGMAYIEVTPTKIGSAYESEISKDTQYEQQIVYMKTSRYFTEISVQALECTLVNSDLNLVLGEHEKPKTAGLLKRTSYKCCPMLAKWLRNHRRRSDVEHGVETKRYVLQSALIERKDLFYTGPAEYRRSSQINLPQTVALQAITSNARLSSINYTISMMHAAHSSKPNRMDYEHFKGTSKHPWLAFISSLNWLPLKIASALQLLFDFRLLFIVEFQILLASAFFFPMGFNILFVYSTVRAEIPAEYRKLISPTIGFSILLFCIISGYLAWKYNEYTTIFCGYGIAIGGLITFISAFYGTNIIWFQFVYAFIYGIAPAFYSTLRAIIYVRALGLDKLTNAFGLTAMSMALGVFIGTTLAGNLNENTGSYTASFAFAGCCLMLAGGLKILLPPFMAWRKRERILKHKQERYTSDS